MREDTYKNMGVARLFLVVFTMCGLATPGAGQRGAGGAGQSQANAAPQLEEYAPVDPMRGPIDLGLTDPALVGAFDLHVHLDPDSPGAGGQVRSIDAFDGAILAQRRGMRGMVYKTHQDMTSAAMAYLVRKHVAPGFEMFGVMALNFATGGINVATVEHFSQIKGGWGRIIMMPTRDSYNSTRNEREEDLPRVRPWMLLMPPGSPKYVATARDGELLPEVKHLIQTMAKMRTVDSNGKLVLATGHATPEEQILLAREGRMRGLNVVLTHAGQLDIPHLQGAAGLGAFLEFTGLDLARRNAATQLPAAAEKIKAVGAEHVIIATDCGQTANPLPTDCLAMAARGLRANGINEQQINLMFKENAAKLLGLPPLAATVPSRGTRAGR